MSAVRLSRAARRTQILALAEVLFLAEGFAAVSMDELAELSGVSKPVIYDHFASKEALFNAILDRHAEALSISVQDAVAGADGPEGRFRAGSTAYFAWVAKRGATVSVVFDGRHGKSGFGDHVRVLRRNQVAQTAAILAESLRRCGARVDGALEADLRPVAEMLAGAYEALALWWQGEQPDMTVAEVTDRFCLVMWPGLLSGLPVLARSAVDGHGVVPALDEGLAIPGTPALDEL